MSQRSLRSDLKQNVLNFQKNLEQCPDLSYKIMLLNVVCWKMFREVLRTFYLN